MFAFVCTFVYVAVVEVYVCGCVRARGCVVVCIHSPPLSHVFGSHTLISTINCKHTLAYFIYLNVLFALVNK